MALSTDPMPLWPGTSRRLPQHGRTHLCLLREKPNPPRTATERYTARLDPARAFVHTEAMWFPPVRALWPLLLAAGAAAQSGPGIFEAHQDVGVVLTPGTAAYDAARHTYTLSASGENMWAAADAFQFAWKKAEGDIRLEADIGFLGEGGDPHRKAVLIVRQSLDADSPYADVAVHGVGLTSLQARDEKGAATHEVQSNVSSPQRVALEKRGPYFFMYVAGPGESLHFAGGSLRIPMEGPFYVGIGVCAHNKDRVEKAVFSNLRLSVPAAGGLQPFSTLETVTVASTDARVTLVSAKRIEAPMWAGEDNPLAYRSQGNWYRVPIAGGAPAPGEPLTASDTEIQSGDYRYFLSETGGSLQLWRAPKTAPGDKEQLTHDDLSNWYAHLSPDGARIVMLSAMGAGKQPPRDADVMLRLFTISTGRLTVLARLRGGQGTLDAPSWSPDSKRLAFVSYQMAAAH
jgi:TolB protein